jgi:inosine-uridine nucleoside N-ribohydrolase
MLPPPATTPVDLTAVAFTSRVLDEAASPVTIVATGPLTNVAHVLSARGSAGIERIVLMGGAIAEGNVTPSAEFNVWADPDAAQQVLHAGLDVTVVGLDVTHKAVTTPVHQERMRAVGPVGTVVAELVDFFSLYHQRTYGWDGAPIHDAVAVAEVILPGLVTTRFRNVEVELESGLTLGETVVDLWRRTDREPNAHVGVDLDTERFFELLLERLARLDREPA